MEKAAPYRGATGAALVQQLPTIQQFFVARAELRMSLGCNAAASSSYAQLCSLGKRDSTIATNLSDILQKLWQAVTGKLHLMAFVARASFVKISQPSFCVRAAIVLCKGIARSK